MKISVKKKAITTTALVSMTDVVFLLLIFILITSNFISYTGIPIEVPVSDSAHTDFQRNISLSINRLGEIYLDTEQVGQFGEEEEIIGRNELIDRLRYLVETNQEIVVMIQADRVVPLGRVVSLIDASKAADAKRFFIAAQLVR